MNIERMIAAYHWHLARLWSELGVISGWAYALDRGAAHIDAWIEAVGSATVERVVRVAGRR